MEEDDIERVLKRVKIDWKGGPAKKHDLAYRSQKSQSDFPNQCIVSVLPNVCTHTAKQSTHSAVLSARRRSSQTPTAGKQHQLNHYFLIT